jgi:hypothetical protein
MYEQQLVAISIGCAMELLSKALVAQVSPALLVDSRDRDRENLLHLTDHGHLAKKKAATEVKTVSGAEAAMIANELHRTLGWRKPADSFVFRVRHAAAHMALVNSDEVHTAVLEMLRYVHGLLAFQGANPVDFWGDLEPLAAELLDEAQSQRRQIVAARRAAAKARLAELVGRLDEPARAVVLASLSGHKMGFADYDEPKTCPVCEQQGWLLCSISRTTHTAYPFVFFCAVCELYLQGDELEEMDLAAEIPLDVDTDSMDDDWKPGRGLAEGAVATRPVGGQ